MKVTPLPHVRLWRLILVLSLGAAGLVAQAAGPKLGGSYAVFPSAEPVDRLVIQYKPTVKLPDMAAPGTSGDQRAAAAALVARSAGLAQAQGVRYLKSVSPQLHVAQLDRALPHAEAQALMERLRVDPMVASVAVDHRLRPQGVVSDPYFTNLGSMNQWHLQDPATVTGGINAAPAWMSSTGAGVTVAVIDGGYRPHADLLGNLLTNNDFDFISDVWTANDGTARDSDASDPGDWILASEATTACPETSSSWHGTHVAGLIGAQANGIEGVGVAHGARIQALRVLGRCGGYESDVMAAARWATGLDVPNVPTNTTPAKVLNLSLGVSSACEAWVQDEVNTIRARGVSIVASTGNDYATDITTPANCKGVIAVTAHTREGDSADYANVGAGVAISAPGGGGNSVLVAQPGIPRGVVSTSNSGVTVPASDLYKEEVGTSMAAPQVAGVLALLASLRPDLPMATLEEIMIGAARPFPAGSYCATNPDRLAAGFCGSGLLDAQRAVAAASSYVAPAAPVAPASDGGGCTVAAAGGNDAGLPLLTALAALALVWRRRRQTGR